MAAVRRGLLRGAGRLALGARARVLGLVTDFKCYKCYLKPLSVTILFSIILYIYIFLVTGNRKYIDNNIKNEKLKNDVSKNIKSPNFKF